VLHVLHRFVAGSASAARRQVGAALGKDALLLSCRDVQEGVEIIAVGGSRPSLARRAAGLMHQVSPGRRPAYRQADKDERGSTAVHVVA